MPSPSVDSLILLNVFVKFDLEYIDVVEELDQIVHITNVNGFFAPQPLANERGNWILKFWGRLWSRIRLYLNIFEFPESIKDSLSVLVEVSSKGTSDTLYMFFFQIEKTYHDFFLDVRHDCEENENFRNEIGKHFPELPWCLPLETNMDGIKDILKILQLILPKYRFPEWQLVNELDQHKKLSVDENTVPNLLFRIKLFHQRVAEHHKWIDKRY